MECVPRAGWHTKVKDIEIWLSDDTEIPKPQKPKSRKVQDPGKVHYVRPSREEKRPSAKTDWKKLENRPWLTKDHKKCEWCGALFPIFRYDDGSIFGQGARQKYCSPTCTTTAGRQRYIARSKPEKSKEWDDPRCEGCGKSMIGQYGFKYCSYKCHPHFSEPGNLEGGEGHYFDVPYLNPPPREVQGADGHGVIFDGLFTNGKKEKTPKPKKEKNKICIVCEEWYCSPYHHQLYCGGTCRSKAIQWRKEKIQPTIACWWPRKDA